MEVAFSRERALSVKNMLVVSDLHLGYEVELLKSGISIPPVTEKMLERLLVSVTESGAGKVVFLGDLAHSIPKRSGFENAQITGFLDSVRKSAEVICVKGNHDPELEKLVPGVVPATGTVISGIGFFHGHTWPSDEVAACRVAVIGHEHPAVEFRPGFGKNVTERCWLICSLKRKELKERYPEARLKKLVVVPAFNPLTGTRSVNSGNPGSPILRLADPEKSEVYLTDGTHLGNLSELLY